MSLELREGVLDGVEAGTVGRQEAEGGAGRLDHLAHSRPLVAEEVVHDQYVTRLKFGHEHLADIGLEGDAVDRPVEHEGRGDAAAAQSGDEGGGLPVPMRHADPESFATSASAMPPRHVRRGPGLVDEDLPLGVKIELAIEPGLPPLHDVGAVLLGSVRGPFFRVMA